MKNLPRNAQEHTVLDVAWRDVGKADKPVPSWLAEETVKGRLNLQVSALAPPRVTARTGETAQIVADPEPAGSTSHEEMGSIFPDLFEPPIEPNPVPRVSLSPEPNAAQREAARHAGASAEPRRRDTMLDDLLRKTEDEAATALADALREISEARQELLRDSEAQLVTLVSTICRRVIAREVSLDPGIVLGLVREGLAALGSAEQVTVRLGPLFAEVGQILRQNLEASGFQTQIVIDDSESPYACRVETELGHVDEALEARLQALIEAASDDSVSTPYVAG